MKNARAACLAGAVFALVLTLPDIAIAQSSGPAAGTPLVQLIETVSKKSGKSFIVDPRVAGNAVLVVLIPRRSPILSC